MTGTGFGIKKRFPVMTARTYTWWTEEGQKQGVWCPNGAPTVPSRPFLHLGHVR
jgi:hypothetical protein